MWLLDDESVAPAFWHGLSLLIKDPVMEPVSVARRPHLSSWVINPTHNRGRLLTRTQITSGSPTTSGLPPIALRESERNNATRGHLGLYTPPPPPLCPPPTHHTAEKHPRVCSRIPVAAIFVLSLNLMSDQRVERSPKSAGTHVPSGWNSASCCVCWFSARPGGGNSSAEAAFPPRLMLSRTQPFTSEHYWEETLTTQRAPPAQQGPQVLYK